MAQAQRFPKLTPDQLTPAQREVAAEITAGPRGEVRGPFIALIHNPELASRVQKLGARTRKPEDFEEVQRALDAGDEPDESPAETETAQLSLMPPGEGEQPC